MMIETFRNIFKIGELRGRILFTFMILAIERIGTHIVTPGIDTAVLAEGFKNLQGTLFGLYDLFAGGAFSKAAIFGLGIMPYISASIVVQLLGMAIPYFQRLQKEGESGRKKINQITRYLTVIILIFQSPAYIANLAAQLPPEGIYPFDPSITNHSIFSFFGISSIIQSSLE